MNVVLGGVNTLSTIDADSISYVVYFQGCKRRCRGCHNPSLLTSKGGYIADTDGIIKDISKYLDLYGAVVFQGGEPLEQKEGLKDLLRKAKALGLETWLYTGYSIDEVPEDIVDLCSVIVAGEFVQELKTNSFPASSNQIILDRRKEDINAIK